MGKSRASVAKMPLVFLPFVYGMGLNQPQPAQKRQKKSTCVTNEDVPPSGQEVAQWILRKKSRRPLDSPVWLQLSILLSEGLITCEWLQTHTHPDTWKEMNKFECCCQMFSNSDLCFGPCSTWAGVQQCLNSLSRHLTSSFNMTTVWAKAMLREFGQVFWILCIQT